jgi:hypothetical protein
MAEAIKDKGAYHEQRQQPADVTFQAQPNNEKGSQTNRDNRPVALEEAVENIDNGLTVKPNQ